MLQFIPSKRTRTIGREFEWQCATSGTQIHLSCIRFKTHSLPLCICSYVSATRLSGHFSLIGCTPVNALNSNVPSESLAVPEYQPEIDRRRMINGITLTLSGSPCQSAT